MIVRARGGGGQAAKPSPIFVLNEKPERKPLHQDMSGAGLQGEIDLGTFKVTLHLLEGQMLGRAHS
jgi:hypothetical protein